MDAVALPPAPPPPAAPLPTPARARCPVNNHPSLLPDTRALFLCLFIRCYARLINSRVQWKRRDRDSAARVRAFHTLMNTLRIRRPRPPLLYGSVCFGVFILNGHVCTLTRFSPLSSWTAVRFSLWQLHCSDAEPRQCGCPQLDLTRVALYQLY